MTERPRICYAQAALKRTGITTQQLADKMLEAAQGVAVLPGGDFGPNGEGCAPVLYVLSHTTPHTNLHMNKSREA